MSPHWLRCRWSKWSELFEARVTMYWPETAQKHVATEMRQQRTCSVCGKIQVRKVAA